MVAWCGCGPLLLPPHRCSSMLALPVRVHMLHAPPRDETTVLALNGLGKVLKANMATVLTLPGFDDKWDEICGIAARVLCCGRRSVAVAAAQLLTGFLQVGVVGQGGRAQQAESCCSMTALLRLEWQPFVH